MEKELDLTLRLGLPTPIAKTHLSLRTPPTTNQGIIGGHGDEYDDDERVRVRRILWGDAVIDDDEGARNNVNVNIRVYNYVFQQFAGIGETLNFAPYPMSTSPAPAPAPATPSLSDYVMIDVPARRAERNNSLAISNFLEANANAKWRRGCYGARIEETKKKCTNMNCNAINTPMWRRGPLGPKSLCNACGIKFRKEEQRRSKRALSN